MALTRRQFMTLTGGSAAAAVIFAACGVPEDELLVQSSVEMPEDLVSGRDNWYATLCAECSAGEGVVVRVMEGRAKKIEGNVDYPINVGKHSARCEAGLQALYNPDRVRRSDDPRGRARRQPVRRNQLDGRRQQTGVQPAEYPLRKQTAARSRVHKPDGRASRIRRPQLRGRLRRDIRPRSSRWRKPT